jgi:FMN phosphatase YigB (HAD superfamily)
MVSSEEVLIVEHKHEQNDSSQDVDSSLLPGVGELRDAKLVSFDFFDTLVFRKSVSHYQMWKNESNLYFFRRASSEFVARVLNRIKGIPEVSESNIYDRMPKRWGVEFEIDLELRTLLPNPVTINLLKQLVLTGVTVCIISDTHYRETDIKRFLNHLVIPEVKIFTSGEYRLTKSTGLFGEVQKNLGVAYTDWIHIGDNLQSDILSSERLGIKSFHYPSIKAQLVNSGLVSPLGYRFLKGSKGPGNESISRIFMNLLSTITKGDSGAPPMPMVLGSVMGDLVSTAIAEEVHLMHCKNKYDRILYSSRDGWLPFLAHEELYPDDPIKYFKTSRKMLSEKNYNAYLASIIGESKSVLLYDLGWRGTTSKKISKAFSWVKWDFVFWQFLGKKSKNHYELNPGRYKNRIRSWRSRDFLESILTDPSRGYDRISIDLVPIERRDQFGSEFKDPILEGAKRGIEHHSAASSLKVASLTLEAFSRYPSKNLIKFAEGYSHQINEDATGLLVITTWKDLFGGSRVLWPYGSKFYSGNKFSRAIFAVTVLLKEFGQRSVNLFGRFVKAV